MTKVYPYRVECVVQYGDDSALDEERFVVAERTRARSGKIQPMNNDLAHASQLSDARLCRFVLDGYRNENILSWLSLRSVLNLHWPDGRQGFGNDDGLINLFTNNARRGVGDQGFKSPDRDFC